jgi:hypothetical protein
VVPTPEPGGQLGECLAFTQVGQASRACRPGFSFRQHDPIEARWRRMIPAAYDKSWTTTQCGTVEKQLESLVLSVDLGRLPQLPGALPRPEETRRTATRP